MIFTDTSNPGKFLKISESSHGSRPFSMSSLFFAVQKLFNQPSFVLKKKFSISRYIFRLSVGGSKFKIFLCFHLELTLTMIFNILLEVRFFLYRIFSCIPLLGVECHYKNTNTFIKSYGFFYYYFIQITHLMSYFFLENLNFFEILESLNNKSLI